MGLLNRLVTILLIGLVGLLLACEPSQDGASDDLRPAPVQGLDLDSGAESAISGDQADEVAMVVWRVYQRQLFAALRQAKALEQAVDQFLEAPKSSTLQAAREQWQLAFVHYQRIEPLLFIGGHAENPVLNQLSAWRSQLSAWPLQPGYLDSYGVHTQSGIVNDISLPLTEKTVRDQHRATGDEEVSLGFYPIEFMLWAEAEEKAAVGRFILQENVPPALLKLGFKPHELPSYRRRELLRWQVKILADDMAKLSQQWQFGGVLTAAFKQLSGPEKALVIHRGLQACLEQIRVLLLKHGTEGHPDGFYFNRFAGDRERALLEKIIAIETIYLSPEIALAPVVLPQIQPHILSEHFASMTKGLGQPSHETNAQVANTISQLLTR